jgi:hypothetical protein
MNVCRKPVFAIAFQSAEKHLHAGLYSQPVSTGKHRFVRPGGWDTKLRSSAPPTAYMMWYRQMLVLGFLLPIDGPENHDPRALLLELRIGTVPLVSSEGGT